ncbi:3404_t:CDS:2 [Dentiscutata erythropus]|uniref:3404_t:CDS:1 n=1 Tax=Dentiscutata erythropus TaxID=1348616 RepID=A0A9N8VBS2_9GLOM|nr:3404_t:CDS:2 [Dentiscutata erythropus]
MSQVSNPTQPTSSVNEVSETTSMKVDQSVTPTITNTLMPLSQQTITTNPVIQESPDPHDSNITYKQLNKWRYSNKPSYSQVTL